MEDAFGGAGAALIAWQVEAGMAGSLDGTCWAEPFLRCAWTGLVPAMSSAR